MRVATRDRRQLAVLLAILTVFVVVGFWLVRSSEGVPATRWMKIYEPSDFDSVRDVIEYLKELRVAIPPVISVLEILNYQINDTTDFVTRDLYRLSLVVTFLVAIVLSSSSLHRLAASSVLSVVFLWSITIIHPGNAQVYDVFFPFFVLLFVFFLALVPLTPNALIIMLLCVASGFFAAMAELSRPFAILILPIWLLGSYQALKSLPIRYFGFFLTPIVLLSGAWHLNLLIAHGQITSTNHSGYNLLRAWGDVVELPTLQLVEEKNNRPIKPDRWPNLNTEEHYENSQRLQSAIIGYTLTHPVDSVAHALRRTATLLSAKTSIYGHEPSKGILSLYRPLVVASSFFLLFNVAILSIYAVRTRRRVLQLLKSPENLIIVTSFLCIIILALGDAEEEARFLISVLPFLAVLPVAQPLDRDWLSLSNPGFIGQALVERARAELAPTRRRPPRRQRRRRRR